MYILTQDDAVVELKGVARISHATYEDSYKIVLNSKYFYTTLGEYTSEESAKNAILAIASYLEKGHTLLRMPKETEKEDGTLSFSADDLCHLKSHWYN